MPLMAPQYVLDDGQPEPGALGSAAARAFDAVKALGEPRQVLGRDTGSLVADRDPHAGPASRPGRNSAGAAASGAASIRTAVPSPPYLIALSIRLTNS